MAYEYEIRYLNGVDALPLQGVFDPDQIPEPWRGLQEARIDQMPWGGDYRPDCRARVGWNDHGIHVLMYADEPEIRTEVLVTGGAVCTDSCLEFFLEPDIHSGLYLNCEVNPVGMTHLGLGDGRFGRMVIHTLPEGMNMTHSEHNGRWWAISYTLPTEFIREKLGAELMINRAMKGNFYKCGDKTAHPHWLMFKPYDTEKPDFHRPEQFTDMTLTGI